MPSARWRRRTSAPRERTGVADVVRRVAARCPRRSAAQVAGPTTPSAVSPWRRWKRFTARASPAEDAVGRLLEPALQLDDGAAARALLQRRRGAAAEQRAEQQRGGEEGAESLAIVGGAYEVS